MNSINDREPPLWWVFLDGIFNTFINLDSVLAWVPSFLLFRLSIFFKSLDNAFEGTKRFIYIQAMIGPHIYAGLLYFFYRFFILDWRLVAIIIFFYFICFIFQYRRDRRIEKITRGHSFVKQKFVRVLVVVKFIFATWAFLIMGIFLFLP